MAPKRTYFLRSTNAKKKKFVDDLEIEELFVHSPCTEIIDSDSESEILNDYSDETYVETDVETETTVAETVTQEPDQINCDVKPDVSGNEREIGDDVTPTSVTSCDNYIYCRELTNTLRNKSEDWFFNFIASENHCALLMLNREQIEVTATRRYDHFYLAIEVNGYKVSPDNPFWLRQLVCVKETGLNQLLKFLNNWNQCPKIYPEKCFILCEKPAILCATCSRKSNRR